MVLDLETLIGNKPPTVVASSPYVDALIDEGGSITNLLVDKGLAP